MNEKYLTVHSIQSERGFGPVVMQHDSRFELRQYLEFHNLLPGEASPGTAYAQVVQPNGEPISDEDFSWLEQQGLDRQGYCDRRNIPGMDETQTVSPDDFIIELDATDRRVGVSLDIAKAIHAYRRTS